MKTADDIFKVDAAKTSETIIEFIRRKTAELRRDGCVIALSGGLDSSTVAALCVRALGADKVTALFLPERECPPEAERCARLCRETFGFRMEKIDISKILRRLGTYDFILSRIPGRAARQSLVAAFLKGKKRHPFLEAVLGRAEPITRRGMAASFTKHRIRLVVACKYAEEHNLLLAGAAHKSEDLVGLFVKHGVDDNADIMPLKNLYRSHILQIARHLGVPAVILNRAPNPEMVPGIEDKYRDILGIDSGQVDLLLHGLETNVPISEIAESTGLPEDKVEEMRSLVQATAHMRHPSMYPLVP